MQNRSKKTNILLHQEKLHLLKAFLTNDRNLIPPNIRQRITISSHVGEIWALLFKHDLLSFYYDLLEAGIAPTAAEMNQLLDVDAVNAWFWLAAKDSEVSIFKHLLQCNLLPSAQALSFRNPVDNTNAWYWLAESKEGSKLFATLIEQDIEPTTDALSVCNTDDNTNVWFLLAQDNNNVYLFDRLLKQSIFPDTATLSAREKNNNTNTWFWLGSDNMRITIFQTLLENNINPSPEDLSARCIDDNTNTWYWLTQDSARIPIFQTLLDNNILPSTESLSTCNLDDNTNGWMGLAEDEIRIAIFYELLQRDITPTNAALSIRKKYFKTHTWDELASINQPISILQELLDRHIFPDSKTLSTYTDHNNMNTWIRLAASSSNTQIFQMLLDKDILPDLSFAKVCSAKMNRHGLAYLQAKWPALNNKILNRLNNMTNLAKEYNLEPSNQITAILSRDDKLNFYGFLYLFYLDLAKPNFSLPIDTWLLIGKHLLPASIDLLHLNTIKNQSSFVKHYMGETLGQYVNGFFIKSHKERATSLKHEIKTHHNPSGVLINQVKMSRTCSSPYKSTNTVKHQQTYTKPITEEMIDKSFDTILREGYFLTRNMGKCIKSAARKPAPPSYPAPKKSNK